MRTSITLTGKQPVPVPNWGNFTEADDIKGQTHRISSQADQKTSITITLMGKQSASVPNLGNFTEADDIKGQTHRISSQADPKTSSPATQVSSYLWWSRNILTAPERLNTSPSSAVIHCSGSAQTSRPCLLELVKKQHKQSKRCMLQKAAKFCQHKVCLLKIAAKFVSTKFACLKMQQNFVSPKFASITVCKVLPNQSTKKRRFKQDAHHVRHQFDQAEDNTTETDLYYKSSNKAFVRTINRASACSQSVFSLHHLPVILHWGQKCHHSCYSFRPYPTTCSKWIYSIRHTYLNACKQRMYKA